MWFGRAGAGPAIVAALIVAAPAGAQVAPANSAAPADTIGPRELRDFSLGAQPTVDTSPPDLVKPPVRSRPRIGAPPPPPIVPPKMAAPVASPTQSPRVETRPETAPTKSTPAPTTALRAPQSVTVPLPPAAPVFGPATPANESAPPSIVPAPIAPDTATLDDSGMSLLPWVLGVLAIALAGLIFVFRGRLLGATRGEPEPAFAGGVAGERAPDPVPVSAAPVPALPRAPTSGGITVRRPDPFAFREEAPPPPPPPPPAPKPLGIVSTRLRPWLEIAFEPSRAVIDETEASVQFNVVVNNSGNGPARNVLVEACLINAGVDQDGELSRFFDAPVGVGERIDAIPPLGSVALTSVVRLPLDQVRAYEVGGRRLFVPVVAFNALYEWGNGQGQSSASFLLGRGGGGGEGNGAEPTRMAPLRLDLGPRLFRDLESRRNPLGVRR